MVAAVVVVAVVVHMTGARHSVTYIFTVGDAGIKQSLSIRLVSETQGKHKR